MVIRGNANCVKSFTFTCMCVVLFVLRCYFKSRYIENYKKNFPRETLKQKVLL